MENPCLSALFWADSTTYAYNNAGQLMAVYGSPEFGPEGGGGFGPEGEGGIEPPPPPPGQTRLIDVYWYHNDMLGTPHALTDEDAIVKWAGKWYPYGELYSETISIYNEFRFPGQWHDRETGLYYNRRRYYDPSTGRYTQADPISLAGGMNMYAYAGNNPSTRIDPLGLRVVPCAVD